MNNINCPGKIVRLVFIHHSCGENWLSDEYGRLGIALAANNYFVSDTNYGWGPGGIGNHTDIGNWWSWFRGENSEPCLNALYTESERHSDYTRIQEALEGENEIIMFKSCFPNSNYKGKSDDIIPLITENPLRGQEWTSEYHTLANAKGIYVDLLEYFKTRPDKLFIAVTAPPLINPEWSENARSFNNWLVNEWLKDYPLKNVAVFDFYNVLTSNGGSPEINDLGQLDGNHHRFENGAVLHSVGKDCNTHKYPLGDDDHPSTAGNRKATHEFIDLLNIYYNNWRKPEGC